MINEKLKDLLVRIIDKTNKKEATWSKGSASNQFKLFLPDGVALTTNLYYEDYTDAETYSVALYNAQGSVIQRFSTDKHTTMEVLRIMKSLHQAASDRYYKVDETLDDLLGLVANDDIIGLESDDDDGISNSV